MAGEFTGYRIEDETPDEVASESLLGWASRTESPYEWPDEIDPRGFVRGENQRRMSSCVGHGKTTAGEIAWHYATGQVLQFSRMFGYLKSQDHGGYTRDNGATIAGAVKAARNDGFCRESLFPYPKSYSRRVPDGAEADAATRKIARTVWLEGYDELIKFLRLRVGGVLVGGPWVASMRAGKDVIETFDGRSSGGHAWAIGGYSTRRDRRGRNYPWAINSHGERWGQRGFAEMSPRAIDELSATRGMLMVGLSHFPDARPPEANWNDGVLG